MTMLNKITVELHHTFHQTRQKLLVTGDLNAIRIWWRSYKLCPILSQCIITGSLSMK